MKINKFLLKINVLVENFQKRFKLFIVFVKISFNVTENIVQEIKKYMKAKKSFNYIEKLFKLIGNFFNVWRTKRFKTYENIFYCVEI